MFVQRKYERENATQAYLQRKNERDNMVTLRWRGNFHFLWNRSPALPSCKELRSKISHSEGDKKIDFTYK